MVRSIPFIGGMLSSFLYAAMNLFVAMQWHGYSSASQTVSELSAIGAPTRPQWVLLGFVYSVLFTIFGWGVRGFDRSNRPLRVAGSLMTVYGAISLAWPLAPMHLRGEEFTISDTMHIVLASTTVLLMMLAIGFGAAAFGTWFRNYSIATLLILTGFGVLTALDGPRIAANLPTPWVGVWERINIGAFLLWVVVLAVILMRKTDDAAVRREFA